MPEKQKEYGVRVIDKRMPVPEHASVQATGSVEQIMLSAVQNKYDPEIIEKMMNLMERHQKELARKAFFKAKAAFKAEAPAVKKDKWNKWFQSWYTSLGNLLDTYNPVLGRHGLSIDFPRVETTDKTMTVECRLSHADGHSESIALPGPIDQAAVGKASGQKSRNALQDVKSTLTYLRSATCEAILGVAGTEATNDDDGNTAAPPPVDLISADQVKVLEELLKETNTDKAKFLEWLKITSFGQLPAANFDNIKAKLEKKKAAMRQPGEEG
jgi:hypothetical protein